MKANVILLLLTISQFLAINAYAQTCPPYGSATDEREQKLNVRKNHPANMPNTAPQQLPLNMLITRSHQADINNFKEGAYVSVVGYLLSFKEEGPESCNCGLANASKKTGDVHIYLGLTPTADKKNCIVVEITPAFKKLHPNYQTYLKNGSKIKVTGYLVYDFIHERNAVNTCTTCTDVWRKTCWEIHPIIQIEQL